MLQRLVGGSSGVAPAFKSGFVAEQGRRQTMEDAHVAVDDLNSMFKLQRDKHRAYYAVYDGHGGRTAADMLEHTLLSEIFKEPATVEANAEHALTTAFKTVDTQILQRAEKEHWTDGSTAVCTLLFGSTVYVACIGDAEAVLQQKTASGVSAQCISFKHKPMDPLEKARIEAAGGRVFLGRVLGTLAVSRAFGDMEYKFPYNKAPTDYVSADPFIQKLTISQENQFMIVACDGLWDKLSYEAAVKMCDQAKNAGKNPQEAAAILVREAIDQGTLDNVTCIVVYFDWSAKRKP